MSSYFEFNGVKSSDMGLCIEKIPNLRLPRKRMTSHQIPGRSGDLHQWDGAFENYPARYQCWFKGEPTGEHLRDVAQWLSSAPAGARLEDSYDPDVFRLVTYVGGADVENIRNRYGRFVVEFDGDPRKFLKSGDESVNVTATAILYNRTSNIAHPMIEIDTNGNLGGVIRINDYSVNLFLGDLPPVTVYVDTDIREAWYMENGIEVSCNHIISSPNWPSIDPGSSSISVSGLGIDEARVFPRWWRV